MDANISIFKNKYQTLELIGPGETGIVYKSKEIGTEKIIAVKILKQELSRNEKFIRQLDYELEYLSQFNYPGIVSILDYGKDNDKYFIVMDYIDGISLENYLQEQGKPELETAIDFIKQIAKILDYTHSNKIVHRAIHPRNIMIDKNGKVFLTNLGISKAAAVSWVTIAGSFSTNVEYMAPEQAEGENVDYRCDLYSLGIVAYRLLTGEVPFKLEGHSILELAMAHINIAPTPPSELNPDLPLWLENIVLKCIEKKAENRLATGKAIYLALENKEIQTEQREDNQVQSEIHEYDDDNGNTEIIIQEGSERKTDEQVNKYEKPDIKVTQTEAPEEVTEGKKREITGLLLIAIVLEFFIIAIFLYILMN